MEKLNTEYNFVVTEHDGCLTIVLTQLGTGATKIFKHIGGTRENMVNHMNSLTDSQCEQWFNVRKPKEKKNA